MSADNVMNEIDAYAYSAAAQPFKGWHDDHREWCRSPQYRPALQQVRAEFREFVRVIVDQNLSGTCLQLGLGEGGASHIAFRQMFDVVCSVDMYEHTTLDLKRRYETKAAHDIFIIGDTHDELTWKNVDHAIDGKIDLLFIDAGHKYADVEQDFSDYEPFVRPGGIIAFHDALKRPGYETEIEVWQFMDELRKQKYPIETIGDEVGIGFFVV